MSPRQGYFSVLDLALPGASPVHLGVLLVDRSTGHLSVRLRRDMDDIAPDEADYLSALKDDLETVSQDNGEVLLDQLEDSLSNILRISDREMVAIGEDPNQTLAWLYHRHIRPKVLPFRTHVPVFYSLRAAAGSYGQDREVGDEPEDWMEMPEGVRLRDDMFVAVVEGHSMEPKIPANSLCLFRRNVAGSRQNKTVLVRRLDSTGSGIETTVKVYRSDKVVTEEGFKHERITMVPLNPAYSSWTLDEGEQLEVIGEFVQVIGPWGGDDKS